MNKHLAIAVASILLPSNAIAAGGAVSSAHPRASEAGQEILREGGSATDAAMAMMLALTVVEPQSSGIGGGGFLIHHDAKTKTVATIDGRETAPKSASATRFMTPDGKPMGFLKAFPGGLSVGIPGNMALMAQAHKNWGKLRWSRLFAPAIKLAEDGYVVNEALADRLSIIKGIWKDFPVAQSIYWEGGAPKTAGAMVKNPALGTFLRRLAKGGPRTFYSSANAKAISQVVASAPRNPAMITTAEIGAYRATPRNAVCTTYRVYKLCGMGPPSSGATTVFQILGMVERFDMKAMGKDDAKSWHVIAEAMRLAYADRETYLGDAGFVNVPVAGLLDKGYIANRSALISLTTSLADYPAGKPPGATAMTTAPSSDVAGTTHFIAVDKTGSVASMTSTIEGPFGSQLIANGYFLNNELTDFTFAPEKDGAPVANRVEAGKRPLSSMSPTIVYDANGTPIFTVGAAGGKTIIMQVAKTLIAHLDWGLSAQDAVAAPNIYYAGDAVQVEANTPLAAMSDALAELGRPVVKSETRLKTNAAELTPTGWRGAADPRSEGMPLDE